MPCDTITTVRLELKSKNVRMDLLRAAVEARGCRIISMDDQQITWDSGSYNRKTEELTERFTSSAEAIKNSYAAILVKNTLTRSGWQVEEAKQ